MSRSKDPIGVQEHKLQWFILELEQTIKHVSTNRRDSVGTERQQGGLLQKAANSDIDRGEAMVGVRGEGGGKDVGVRETSSGLSRGIWFQPLSTLVHDRSVHSCSVRLLFSKPFLALLQIFIEQHRQVPDHERQHNPGEEFGRVSKLCL